MEGQFGIGYGDGPNLNFDVLEKILEYCDIKTQFRCLRVGKK